MKKKDGIVHRQWQSVGFRLAFYYGFMVTVIMLATVSIIYIQTVGVLFHGVSRQVQASGQKLSALYERDGQHAVVLEIERALGDELNASTELFLYQDGAGQKLVGNVDSSLLKMEATSGGVKRLVARGGIEVQAYLSIWVFSDGSKLLVGSDLREQEAIDALVTSGIGVACAVAIALLVGGIFLFRLELERSVVTLRQTLKRVADGDLKQRVGPLGQEDEFALLGNDINEMLDQIEILINGVRHVSDTIAHNLRTPLTRIYLRLQSVGTQLNAESAYKETVDATLRDVEDLISVFEKLLQLAEAEAGVRRINFQKVEISSVVAEVLDFYGTVAETLGTRLSSQCMTLDFIKGDPDLLAGALSNLIDNAFKYGGKGVVVTVKCASSKDFVVLTVQDNGPGIPANLMTQLGARFFRVDRNGAGHGLGLASVKAVVALHGGRVWFEDAHPGLAANIQLPTYAEISVNGN
jgi:signal transduction histidine kinase